MCFLSFHSLNLNHEARELEEMIIIKILSVWKLTILNLHENFVDEGIVSIVKHIIDIILHDFKKFSIGVFECSFVNNKFAGNNFVKFVIFSNNCVRLLSLFLS